MRTNKKDSVLRKQFSGDMVSAKPRLSSDFASGGGGVWGGILRLLHPFLLAKFGADKNTNTSYHKIVSAISFASGSPCLKEINPRHPPRVFPLGLRAPRLLCVLLFLAIAPVRWRGEGRTLFGGRKESFPQLRSPPRSGLLEYSVLPFVMWSFRVFWLRLACLRSPPSHNPLPRFHVRVYLNFRVLRFLLRRRSSFSPGRPSGNTRGGMQMRLTHPSRSRASEKAPYNFFGSIVCLLLTSFRNIFEL
jgi:hypothetical protein